MQKLLENRSLYLIVTTLLTVCVGAGTAKVSQVKSTSNGPKALIIEPSKELAEQTLNNVKQFKKYVENPKLRHGCTRPVIGNLWFLFPSTRWGQSLILNLTPVAFAAGSCWWLAVFLLRINSLLLNKGCVDNTVKGFFVCVPFYSDFKNELFLCTVPSLVFLCPLFSCDIPLCDLVIRLTLSWVPLVDWTTSFPLENWACPKCASWSWMNVYVQSTVEKQCFHWPKTRSYLFMFVLFPAAFDDLFSEHVLFLPQDGLLSAGYTDFINRIHNQTPQVTSDGKRLQVIPRMSLSATINRVCSESCRAFY